MTTKPITAAPAITDLDAELARIAEKFLGVETLVTQRRDELDFHDLHVAALKAALKAAYEAGVAAAGRSR
jgi:hypothetical protein